MKTICLILFLIVSVSARAQNSPDDSNAVSALLKDVNTFEGPNAPTIRSNAAIQLASRGDIKVLIPLTTANPDPFVRKMAVAGITLNADPAVTKALIAALHDKDAQVREAAGVGLELTAREIIPGEIDALVKCLGDEDTTAVAQAAGVLYNQPGAADLAIPQVKKLLQSQNADVKEAAAAALKVTNNEDALGVFLHTLAVRISEENGNKWTATLRIVDEVGRPIGGANVSVIYYVPAGPSEDPDSSYREIKGLTDKHGIFVASHKDSSGVLAFNVQKEGYYSANGSHEFIKFQDNDPSKLNPNVTLILKKRIGHPIPMYARWIESGPPALKITGRPPINFDRSIGYDLLAGDWVAPYGKGVHANVIFREKFDEKSTTDFYYQLTVRFPQIGDGIQEYTVSDAEKADKLRSPHEAPLDGYQNQLIKENYHHPGQAGKPSDFDESRTYLFRVTLQDGPHYGKIYGDFIRFCYYLNPVPNDRVIEFDPHHNLFKLGRYDWEVSGP